MIKYELSIGFSLRHKGLTEELTHLTKETELLFVPVVGMYIEIPSLLPGTLPRVIEIGLNLDTNVVHVSLETGHYSREDYGNVIDIFLNAGWVQGRVTKRGGSSNG